MTKYVLVTGGAGYIGSHVCKELFKSGYLPVTLDNLSTGKRELVKWGPFYNGDIKSESDLRMVFKDFQFETVIHLAAKAYVNESVRDPQLYYRENVLGSMNLVDFCLTQRIKSFVFSSSCATYGNPTGLTCIGERTPQKPVNPYGFTKLVVERYLKDLKSKFGFNLAILRYFNAAGADPDGQIGEVHSPETHLIPSMISALLEGKSFKIFGADYNTIDGTPVRDYVHVTDLAIAHVKSLQYILSVESEIVCNVGTGKGYSVLELAKKMQLLNPGFHFELSPRRPGDPDQLIACNEKSQRLLGLSYSHSEIAEILESAYKWHIGFSG